MAVITHQYIVWHCIEDVILAISEIAFLLFLEAKVLQFFIDFLLSGFTLSQNEWLAKGCTNLSVTIFSKPYENIFTIREKFVVYGNAFEERYQIVIRITEIIKFIYKPAIQ